MERVIIKVKRKMPPDCMESIAKRIREQYERGLLIIDDSVDIFIIEDPKTIKLEEANEEENNEC